MLTFGQLRILSFWAKFNLNVAWQVTCIAITTMCFQLSHVISELYSVIGFGVIVLLL